VFFDHLGGSRSSADRANHSLLFIFLIPQMGQANQIAREAVSRPAGGVSFVGANSCGVCHANEFRQWSGSHHQLAVQPAANGRVLGAFDDASFPAMVSFRPSSSAAASS
jgi:hypothetical protein